MLHDKGWKSFTAIELPEFEGFSSGEHPSGKIVGTVVLQVSLIRSALTRLGRTS